jgi:hypothetical protein
MMIDKYGWRDATKAEVEDLAKRMDLEPVFHSVADASLWYLREEAKTCKDYMDCTPYARHWVLTGGYQINQRNVDRENSR